MENRRQPSEPVPRDAEPSTVAPASERHRQALRRLEEGTEAVRTSAGFRQWIAMAAKFHQYSLNNTLLIMIQRPDATMVNAYDRWKGLGRQVKRGETGIKIFYPVVKKVEETDLVTGELTERSAVVSFGIGNVFDVSQTEGAPLPEPPDIRDHTETDDRATALHLKLSRFLMDEGVRLAIEPMHGHKRGSWNPEQNTIVLKLAENCSPFTVGITRTLVHEAAHYLADHRGAINRDDAEAVAEGATFIAMSHFGLDVGDTSFPYIATWAADRQTLTRNLGEIQKIGSKVITAVESVGDPYADGQGSFSQAWGAKDDALDEHLEADDEDRWLADEFPDRHFC